jgi:hypothetical protein
MGDNPYGATTLEEFLEAIKPAPLLAGTINAWVESFGPGDVPVAELNRIWSHAFGQASRGIVIRSETGKVDASWIEPIIAAWGAQGAPYFLVAALRIALDHLIAENFGRERSEAWRRIADARLPHRAIIAVAGFSPPSGPVVVRPSRP